jgi:hypothetical protein
MEVSMQRPIKTMPVLVDGKTANTLFSGRKVTMRRPIKTAVRQSSGAGYSFQDKDGRWWSCGQGVDAKDTQRLFIEGQSPIQAGDRLWVREAFRVSENTFNDLKGEYCIDYPANDGCTLINPNIDNNDHLAYAILKMHVSPSIHMPRYASRMTLHVTNVRVERIRDITNEEAVKEGMPTLEEAKTLAQTANMSWHQRPSAWFKADWQRRHGTWYQNPFVWCVDFHVYHQNVDQQQ